MKSASDRLIPLRLEKSKTGWSNHILMSPVEVQCSESPVLQTVAINWTETEFICLQVLLWKSLCFLLNIFLNMLCKLNSLSVGYFKRYKKIQTSVLFQRLQTLTLQNRPLFLVSCNYYNSFLFFECNGYFTETLYCAIHISKLDIANSKMQLLVCW